MGFIGLFLFFLFGVMLVMMLVPVVGGFLGLAASPLLTLGAMIAARAVQQDQAVHALQLFEGLRGPSAVRRRSLLWLCAVYGACSVAVLVLADQLDAGAFQRLQVAAMTPDTKPEDLVRLASVPSLGPVMALRVGLITLLSVLFWHAPALVHWGGQGAAQALFSSTVAVWRNRGAFAVYALGWIGVAATVGLVVTLVAVLVGQRQIVGLMTMPLGLIMTAAFYASLWPVFADSFADDDQGHGPTPGPSPAP